MLIRLTTYGHEDCIVNTDNITSMTSDGSQFTCINLVTGKFLKVRHPMSEIITIIEKGGNIYDTEGEA